MNRIDLFKKERLTSVIAELQGNDGNASYEEILDELEEGFISLEEAIQEVTNSIAYSLESSVFEQDMGTIRFYTKMLIKAMEI